MDVTKRTACVGCGEVAIPAAFAIMHPADAPKGRKPDAQGRSGFAGYATCVLCFTEPEHRKRKLKAHFAMPGDVARMVGAAGSSSIG